MRRGELSNVAVPELWVTVDAVYEVRPGTIRTLWRPKLVLPATRRIWLDLVRRVLTPVLIVIGDEKEPADATTYLNYVQHFPSWSDAVAVSRASPSVVEIVTGNPMNVADGVVLIETEPARYRNFR